jgi:hypothetical protein
VLGEAPFLALAHEQGAEHAARASGRAPIRGDAARGLDVIVGTGWTRGDDYLNVGAPAVPDLSNTSHNTLRCQNTKTGPDQQKPLAHSVSERFVLRASPQVGA